ncbi:Adenylate kinase/UMP-CMP kinase protein [Dioscorea alata]|uniref:Adenylate kinase/UMP-CMP kinase protein n=1 Tax=Dioscorea alata TaxID=55571 RepID=A0ACB7WV23_DIOAL|nr:Adenylate kinase/UMP-CMP kinase protein [Dioscorea alata]
MGTMLDATVDVPVAVETSKLQDADESFPGDKKITVVFVLGGPGSGKGTQCANIVQHFGFTHLSAGDLLRAEIKSGSENGTMIQNMIKEGKIVPSEVTIKLLQRAMRESGNDKFLIDGFPRNEENRAAFEEVTKIEPEFVLFFDCPEEEMQRRILGRNQGREDDNIETIRKRFKVFMESSLPVIEYYNSKGKVRKIDAGKPIEEVFEDVKEIFSPYSAQANLFRNLKVNTIMRFPRRWPDFRIEGSLVTWWLRVARRVLFRILSKARSPEATYIFVVCIAMFAYVHIPAVE